MVASYKDGPTEGTTLGGTASSVDDGTNGTCRVLIRLGRVGCDIVWVNPVDAVSCMPYDQSWLLMDPKRVPSAPLKVARRIKTVIREYMYNIKYQNTNRE